MQEPLNAKIMPVFPGTYREEGITTTRQTGGLFYGYKP